MKLNSISIIKDQTGTKSFKEESSFVVQTEPSEKYNKNLETPIKKNDKATQLVHENFTTKTKLKKIENFEKIRTKSNKAESSIKKGSKLDFYSLKGMKKRHTANYKQASPTNVRTNKKKVTEQDPTFNSLNLVYTNQEIPLNLIKDKNEKDRIEKKQQYNTQDPSIFSNMAPSINSIQNQIGSQKLYKFYTQNQIQLIESFNNQITDFSPLNTSNKKNKLPFKSINLNSQRQNEIQTNFSPVLAFENESRRYKFNSSSPFEITPKRRNFNVKLPKLNIGEMQEKKIQELNNYESKRYQDIQDIKSPLTVKKFQDQSELITQKGEQSLQPRKSLTFRSVQNLNFAEISQQRNDLIIEKYYKQSSNQNDGNSPHSFQAMKFSQNQDTSDSYQLNVFKSTESLKSDQEQIQQIEPKNNKCQIKGLKKIKAGKLKRSNKQGVNSCCGKGKIKKKNRVWKCAQSSKKEENNQNMDANQKVQFIKDACKAAKQINKRQKQGDYIYVNENEKINFQQQ